MLFTFVKQDPKELDAEEGDVLLLIKYEEDWALVKGRSGEGLVPASYIEPVTQQTFC